MFRIQFTNQYLTLQCLLVFFSAFFSQKARAADQQHDVPQVISASVEVTKRGLLHEDYSVKVDVGTLPMNEVFQYIINLENTTSTSFEVTEITQSCKCVSAQIDRRQYEVGENIPIKLSVSTNQRVSGAQVVQSLFLFEKKNGNSRVIPLTVTFKISGVLAFTQEMYVISVSEQPDEHEISIPFHFSAPVQIPKLILKSDATAMLKNPRFAPGKSPDSGLLKFVISSQILDVPTDPITLQIKDQEYSKADSTVLVIQKKALFDVAPSILRFRKVENKDEYLATAIVVRRGDAKSLSESQVDLNVEASIGGKQMQTDITRSTEHMAKIAISVNQTLLDQADDKKVRWYLFGPEGKASVSTSFIIEKE